MRNVPFRIVHLLTTVARHLPQGLAGHHCRRVRQVRRLSLELSAPLDPILFPQRTTYLPANSEGSPYRPGLNTPHHLDRYSNCSRVVLKKKYMARDLKIGVFGVFGVLFQLPGNFLQMAIEVS